MLMPAIESLSWQICLYLVPKSIIEAQIDAKSSCVTSGGVNRGEDTRIVLVLLEKYTVHYTRKRSAPFVSDADL